MMQSTTSGDSSADLMSQFDPRKVLEGVPTLGGCADARMVSRRMTALGYAEAGNDRNLYMFEGALDAVLEGSDSVHVLDDDSAYGYAHVLSAVQRMPMMTKINPFQSGRVGASLIRMKAVIDAATKRQAEATLRPDVILVQDFDHDAANIAAGGQLQAKTKPTIPGVSTDYESEPLTVRQLIVLLLAGSFANAVMNPYVAGIPMFEMVAAGAGATPNGINILRFATVSYNWGISPFKPRGTDRVTSITELRNDSFASAVVHYQLLWEMRAVSAFGAGSRCVLPRGPNSLHGPAAFAIAHRFM